MALGVGTIGFFLLYSASFDATPITLLSAELTRYTLAWFGVDVHRIGTQIVHDGGFICTVGVECTIVLPLAALWIALAVAPLHWRQRARSALFGALLITLVNTVRLDHLVWIGIHTPEQLDLWHHVIWRTVMIVLPLGVFAFATRAPRQAEAP